MSWFAEDIKLQCRVSIGGGACPPSPPSFKSHGICCGISVQYPETLTLTGSAIRPGLLPWVCLQQLAAVTVAGPTGAVQLTATRPAPPSQSTAGCSDWRSSSPAWPSLVPSSGSISSSNYYSAFPMLVAVTRGTPPARWSGSWARTVTGLRTFSSPREHQAISKET